MHTAALSLGTVKLGRATGVKYPTPVRIPDDQQAAALLAHAASLGINLLDTAPAYGESEIRLGRLLQGQRDQWLICTKVGEEFDGRNSTHNFTPEHCRYSITRSLERLQTDYLDIALIHSDGADLHILNHCGTLDMLIKLKQEGLVRAVGISHKSVEGAELALTKGADVIMATLNQDEQQDRQVIAKAAQAGCGVMIKKALRSGHGNAADLTWVAAQPGVHTIVVGTTNPAHLTANAACINQA